MTNEGSSAERRTRMLADIQRDRFDLIIIGGGITGAGILREASLQGLSAILIEAEDFASGTSSKSTKLIHGGLRYLAMGHIHVVREAARERKRVYQLAPHLAEPRWLMVPASNRLELAKYQLAIFAYEKLGQVDKSDTHFILTGSELPEREPLLNSENFPHACFYREYLTDDARLVIANIRAGVASGGMAVNKLHVTGIVKDYANISGVWATCGLTGEEVLIKGRVVVNAAGPWVEDICQLDGLKMPKSMVLSRGIHIVVPFQKLPVNEMVFTMARDNRPVFIIPRDDVTYIGTTDSLHAAGAEFWPEVIPEEAEYLFEPVERYFNVQLELKDVLTSWAGLRPLIHQHGKSTKEISRRDEIWVSQSGLVTIAGGKLTGYRKMAEDTVAEASKMIGFDPTRKSVDKPLPGGDIQEDLSRVISNVMAGYPIEERCARRLVSLYGGDSEAVLRLGAEPIVTGGMVLTGEIFWAMQQEFANSLEDVLYRRTRAALYNPSEVANLVEPVANLMKDSMGWDEIKRTIELTAVNRRIRLDSTFTQC